MLRGNLASRPFYNDRLVAGVLGLVALAALGLTAFNATQLWSLSKLRGALNAQITKNTADAQQVEARVAVLKRSIDVARLRLLAGNAREANDLIDKRTFSWTVFFGVIERTLPLDARLVAVTPKVEKGVMRVGISVVCQQPEDLQSFVLALDKSGVFRDVNPAARQSNDDGTETALIEAIYSPVAAPVAQPPAKPAGKGRS